MRLTDSSFDVSYARGASRTSCVKKHEYLGHTENVHPRPQFSIGYGGILNLMFFYAVLVTDGDKIRTTQRPTMPIGSIK